MGIMERRKRIVILGNSLILGTLGESLRRCGQFELTALVPQLPEARELEALKPDAVFFDLEAPRSEMVFSLLESHPRLLFLGISPDSNVVKMWAGRQLRELSTQGLLEVIDEQLKNLQLESDIKG